MAESTLRHNQPSGTITVLAQHCGRVNPVAQSTIQHIHHSGTVNSSAQSTIRHYHPCGTRCRKHPDTPLHNSMIDARLVHSARIIIVESAGMINVPHSYMCRSTQQSVMFTPWMPLPLRHRTPSLRQNQQSKRDVIAAIPAGGQRGSS